MFCFHKWKVETRRFTPPTAGLFKVRWCTQGFMDRAMHGFTIIEQRCVKCGLTSLQEIAGDQR